MKKLRITILVLVAFFASVGLVRAECDSKESNRLNSLAVNVKVSYVEDKKKADMSGEFNPPDGLSEEELEGYIAYITYFKVYIANVTEELYVIVTNNVTKESKTYSYQDAVDGTITFDHEDLTVITNYTIDVYASSNTECANTKLTTHYLTTPKYNSYSDSTICEGIENFYLCHKYLAVKAVGFDEFVTLAERYKKGQIDSDGSEIVDKEPGKDNFFDYIKEHKGIVIGTVVTVLVIGGLVTVIIVKKQRSRIV